MTEFEELQSVPELLPIYLEQGPEGVLSATMPNIGRPWTSTEKQIYLSSGILPYEIGQPPNPGSPVKS